MNGRLVGMLDRKALADALVRAYARPTANESLREAARRTVVERDDRSRVCLPEWEGLVEEVLAGV